MPVVKVSQFDGAEGVTKQIELLESTGCSNFGVALVGDQYVITYDVKRGPGRPPKTEMR